LFTASKEEWPAVPQGLIGKKLIDKPVHPYCGAFCPGLNLARGPATLTRDQNTLIEQSPLHNSQKSIQWIIVLG